MRDPKSPPGKFRAVSHDGVLHMCLWDQRWLVFDSDEWIEYIPRRMPGELACGCVPPVEWCHLCG